MVREQRQAIDQWREARNRVIIRPKYVKLILMQLRRQVGRRRMNLLNKSHGESLDATRKNESGSKAHTCYKVNVQYTAASNVDSNQGQPLERRVSKLVSTQSLERRS